MFIAYRLVCQSDGSKYVSVIRTSTPEQVFSVIHKELQSDCNRQHKELTSEIWTQCLANLINHKTIAIHGTDPDSGFYICFWSDFEDHSVNETEFHISIPMPVNKYGCTNNTFVFIDKNPRDTSKQTF